MNGSKEETWRKSQMQMEKEEEDEMEVMWSSLKFADHAVFASEK